MCGIAGIFGPAIRCDLSMLVSAMTDPLIHRGPDGADIWHDQEHGIAFGHRRLSIIDLSEAGRQPMTSSCGRLVITYNGEIYNAAELRDDLIAAGRSFRGHSDTEVIVEACAEWGVRRALDRLIGMFAIGLWDNTARELTLIRDRLGIKPLYWSFDGGTLLFGSELKSLTAFPDFDRTIDRDAVVSYLRHSYVPAPRTIYKAARKLEPGQILSLVHGGEPRIEAYWSLSDAARAGQRAHIEGRDEDVVDQLETLLGDAVSRRMVSDVPLGAFLSGGIDSSTVAALMQRASSRPVRTFSIGFNVPGYNEAEHAAAVAGHLGTDHTELYVEPDETREVIPKLARMYDEPFSDSSQIPTYLVSALTRNHVTVALSGDGGDELFAGYNRYVQAETFMRRAWRVPRPVRAAAGQIMTAVPIAAWDEVLSRTPMLSHYPTPGDKVHKLASVLHEDKEGFYRRLVTHWEHPEELVRDGREVVHPLWNEAESIVPDFTDRMQYVDTLTYLPDDILTKIDRASMAVSLEARVPILDHRVVEFSWRLPRRFKVRDGASKWILRQVLYRHVPRHLIDRPKMGFAVPIDRWLRGPLKDWAGDLLSADALNRYGLIEPDLVAARWQEHLGGRRNWQHCLWNILMLQAWCQEWA